VSRQWEEYKFFVFGFPS